MAQWIKHLLYRCEDLSSNPRNAGKARHGSMSLQWQCSCDEMGGKEGRMLQMLTGFFQSFPLPGYLLFLLVQQPKFFRDKQCSTHQCLRVNCMPGPVPSALSHSIRCSLSSILEGLPPESETRHPFQKPADEGAFIVQDDVRSHIVVTTAFSQTGL